MVNVHWRLLLLLHIVDILLRGVLVHEYGSERAFLHIRRRLWLDLWRLLDRLIEKLSCILVSSCCRILLAGCATLRATLNLTTIVLIVTTLLLLVWDGLEVPTHTLKSFLNLVVVCSATSGVFVVQGSHFRFIAANDSFRLLLGIIVLLLDIFLLLFHGRHLILLLADFGTF